MNVSTSLRTDDNSDIMEMHVDDPPHIELKWVPGHARPQLFYGQSTFCSEPSNDFMGTVDRCWSHSERNCDNHLPVGFQESGIQSFSYSCGVKQVTLWPKSQFEPGMGSLRFRSRPSPFPDARSYSTNLGSPRTADEHGHTRGLIDGKGLRVSADSIFIHSFRESIKKNPTKNTEPCKILAPPGSLLPADASYGTKHQCTPSIFQGKFKHHEGAKAYGKKIIQRQFKACLTRIHQTLPGQKRPGLPTLLRTARPESFPTKSLTHCHECDTSISQYIKTGFRNLLKIGRAA